MNSIRHAQKSAGGVRIDCDECVTPTVCPLPAERGEGKGESPFPQRSGETPRRSAMTTWVASSTASPRWL